APDNTTVLTASRNRVWLWDARAGKQLQSPRHAGGLSLPFLVAPDGTSFLTLSSDFRTLSLWKSETGRFVGLTSPGKDRGWTAAFSGNGKSLETSKGKLVGVPLQHPDEVGAAAISPDGRLILTGTSQRGPVALGERIHRETRFWDGFTGMPLGPPIHTVRR